MMNGRSTSPNVSVYGVVALAAVVLAGWYCWQSGGQIPVSKETTFLTGPLLPDGRVNYALAIVQQRKQDATPQNNAAIPFLQATWPCDIQPAQWGPLCRELKIKLPEENGLRMPYHPDCVAPFRAWLSAQTHLDESQDFAYAMRIRHLMIAACEAPWQEEQFPPLAAWLQQQAPHLDRLHQIHDKTHFYFPATQLTSSPDAELTAIRFPANQYLRIAAEALAVRAMHSLGRDQPEAAWQDVRTIYALSRLCPAHPSLIELNSSYMVREQAIAVTHTLVTSGQCDAALLAKIRRHVDETEPVDQVKVAVCQYERIVALDAITRGVTRQSSSDVNLSSLDPIEMTKRLNDNFNQIGEILQTAELTERRAELKEMERELSAGTELSLIGQLVGVVQFSAEGRRAADNATAVFLPSVMQLCATEARVNAGLHLLDVAVHLETHHQRTGEYPETLTAALNPDLARDPFGDGPLQYRRFPQGYLLYSLYENRIDDTLEHLSDDAESFVLPKKATPNLDIFLATPSPTFKSELEAELQEMAP